MEGASMSPKEFPDLQPFLELVKQAALLLVDSIAKVEGLLCADRGSAGGASSLLSLWKDLSRSDPLRKDVAGVWVADDPITVEGFNPSASALEAIHRIAWRIWELTLIGIGDADFASAIRRGEVPQDDVVTNRIKRKWLVIRSLVRRGIPCFDVGKLKALLHIEYARVATSVTGVDLAFGLQGPSIRLDEFVAARHVLPYGWRRLRSNKKRLFLKSSG
jgi:hypothetical protein